MTASPYKNVTWPIGAPVVTDTLNDMANNDQWLFENMPRIQYSAHGIKRNSGIKILAGVTRYPGNETVAEGSAVDISFGSFFTPGCNPVVVATISASSSPHKKYVTTSALGAHAVETIDHRGFSAYVSAMPWSGRVGFVPLGNSGLVHYIAIGY